MYVHDSLSPFNIDKLHSKLSWKCSNLYLLMELQYITSSIVTSSLQVELLQVHCKFRTAASLLLILVRIQSTRKTCLHSKQFLFPGVSSLSGDLVLCLTKEPCLTNARIPFKWVKDTDGSLLSFNTALVCSNYIHSKLPMWIFDITLKLWQ